MMVNEHQRNHQSFSTIANSCPSLQVLRVEFNSEEDFTPIDYSALEPLVTKLRLASFRIEHLQPLELTQGDLVEIARAWGPTLQILDLNGSPAHLPTSLTVAALLPFALHCPKLRDLSIYIDATLAAEEQDDTYTTAAFHNLRLLGFGHSKIEDPWMLVPYLQRLTLPLQGMIRIHGDATEWTGMDPSYPDPWAVVRKAIMIMAPDLKRLVERAAGIMGISLEKFTEKLCVKEEQMERQSGA